MKKKNKVTITLDLDEVREYARGISKANGGLESSGGVDPNELDCAFDGMRSCLPDSAGPFSDLVSRVISILSDAHSEFEGEELELDDPNVDDEE